MYVLKSARETEDLFVITGREVRGGENNNQSLPNIEMTRNSWNSYFMQDFWFYTHVYFYTVVLYSSKHRCQDGLTGEFSNTFN